MLIHVLSRNGGSSFEHFVTGMAYLNRKMKVQSSMSSLGICMV
jgi:hypothetical protein